MKWEVTGIDPNKPAKDKGRVVIEDIVSSSITGAVATFCNKHPRTIQLSIVSIEDRDSEAVAA